MAEEARDESKTILRRSARRHRGVPIYALLPAVSLSARPLTHNARRSYQTLLALPEHPSANSARPCSASSEPQPSASSAPARSTRPAGRRDPSSSHHRWIIRRSRVGWCTRCGPAPSVCPPPAQLHTTATPSVVGILVLPGRIACATLIPGSRSSWATLLTRFGAMRPSPSRTSLSLAAIKDPDRERPTVGPGTLRIAASSCRCFAVRGARHGGLVRQSHAPSPSCTSTSRWAGITWLLLLASPSRRRPPPPGPGSHPDARRWLIPQPVFEHEAAYDSARRAFELGHFRAHARGDGGQAAARRRRASTCSCRSRAGVRRRSNARMEDRSRSAAII